MKTLVRYEEEAVEALWADGYVYYDDQARRTDEARHLAAYAHHGAVAPQIDRDRLFAEELTIARATLALAVHGRADPFLATLEGGALPEPIAQEIRDDFLRAQYRAVILVKDLEDACGGEIRFAQWLADHGFMTRPEADYKDSDAFKREVVSILRGVVAPYLPDPGEVGEGYLRSVGFSPVDSSRGLLIL